MNKERMLLLAELLETIKPHKFNLETWVSVYDEECNWHSSPDYVDLSAYNCNSAACVAGWAVAMKNDLTVDDLQCRTVEEEAIEYLGLNYREAQHLFYYGSDSIYEQHRSELGILEGEPLAIAVTAKHAAMTIRKVVDGEWSLG